MSSLTLPVTLLLLVLSFLAMARTGTGTATSTSIPRRSNPSSFIKDSCGCTRYPALCISSLSTYASTIQQSPKQMAQTALLVSLARTRSAATSVSQMSKLEGMKAREYQVVKDCVDNMSDSVDRLSRSIKELGQMRRVNGQDEDFMWHMSNVQTWVSAALTDDNTCIDGFSGRTMGGKVKAAIHARVVNAAQVTSNALALVNRFANRRHH